MNRCTRCKQPMALGAQGGEYCPNDCDRIPIALEEIDNTVLDTNSITRPFIEPCCKNPDLAPFELRAGEVGHHCWSCGKVLK